MGEIHVKDPSNSLREVRKVFVKDSGGTLRGPIRKAFVLDGSNVRDVFTKIDKLSVSGTPNSFTAATVEKAHITVSSIDNAVTATTRTRSIGTSNQGGTVSLSTVQFNVYGYGAGNDIETVAFPGGQLAIGDTISFSNVFYQAGVSNGGGFNASAASIYLASNSAGTIVSGGYLGNGYQYGDGSTSGYFTNNFTVATSTQASATHLASRANGGGAQFSQENTYVYGQVVGFSATVVQNRSYNNVTITNTNYSANGGASFSISGPFSVGSTTFSNTDSINTAASNINTAIQSALPAGASSSVSNNVVTINFAAGAVTDLVISTSNGSASGSTVPANTNGATATYTEGGSVTASTSIATQGTNQSGSLTVVPITTGSTTTNITIPNNTDADGAGTAIASALDAVSGVSSSYDSGTNKVTVITSGDVSVGTISNANSLSVSVD